MDIDKVVFSLANNVVCRNKAWNNIDPTPDIQRLEAEIDMRNQHIGELADDLVSAQSGAETDGEDQGQRILDIADQLASERLNILVLESAKNAIQPKDKNDTQEEEATG